MELPIKTAVNVPTNTTRSTVYAAGDLLVTQKDNSSLCVCVSVRASVHARVYVDIHNSWLGQLALPSSHWLALRCKHTLMCYWFILSNTHSTSYRPLIVAVIDGGEEEGEGSCGVEE